MKEPTQTTLRTLLGNPPQDGKFVALYDDGSGAKLFRVLDSGEYLDAEGELYGELEHFSHWVAIPDDFKFWHENKEDAA